MTYLFAVLAFWVFYGVVVLAPFAMILAVSNYLVELPALLLKIVAAVSLLACVVALYRAHLAAGLVASGIGWFDAHQSSGAMTRTMLSFLPVVGRLFQEKR